MEDTQVSFLEGELRRQRATSDYTSSMAQYWCERCRLAENQITELVNRLEAAVSLRDGAPLEPGRVPIRKEG